MSYRLLTLPDGRDVEVLESGSGERALVFLWGTPGGAVPDPHFDEVAERYGLRVLQPNRPGYGQSSPQPGRRIVDLVADVQSVLEQLGIDEVVCMGGSGGGPHSLAMAAHLPQCRAAAVLVSPAPRDAEGLDFYDGMAASNQEEWRLADLGEAAVRPWLEKVVADQETTGGDNFAEQFADCIAPQDRAVLDGPGAALRTARFTKAVEHGIEGWLGDDIAMTTPWGFALESVRRPVAFWAGRADQFVSYRHSLWMAQRVPTADLHVLADEGHLSLRMHHMDAVMRDLVGKAGWTG
jgi:pimeloyl-ACP methyl ester carboxylesterase